MVKMIYKTYDELPLFIDVKTVSSVLGISRSGAYELMHEKNFSDLEDRRAHGSAEGKIY